MELSCGSLYKSGLAIATINGILLLFSRRKYIYCSAPMLKSQQVYCSKTLLIVSNIDDSRLELPGRDLTVEQDIKLTVRAVLELRQEEEGHNPAHTGGASPDEATLARDVPARGVEQLRREVDHGDLGDVVGGAADTRAQGAEPHGGGLGDDGVGDGPQRAGVDERDEDPEDGLGVVGRGALRDRGADAEDHEEGDVDARAPEVDRAAAEPGGDEPGADVGDELEA